MSPTTVFLKKLCSYLGFSEFQTKFRMKNCPIISILYVLYDQLYVVVMIENYKLYHNAKQRLRHCVNLALQDHLSF